MFSGCVPTVAWPHMHSNVTSLAWPRGRWFNSVLTACVLYTRTPTFRSITRATNQRACEWTDDPAYTINVGSLNTFQSRVLLSACPLRLINVWFNSRHWSSCHSDWGGSMCGWEVNRRSTISLQMYYNLTPWKSFQVLNLFNEKAEKQNSGVKYFSSLKC